jgi:hypothetical protein
MMEVRPGGGSVQIHRINVNVQRAEKESNLVWILYYLCLMLYFCGLKFKCFSLSVGTRLKFMWC